MPRFVIYALLASASLSAPPAELFQDANFRGGFTATGSENSTPNAGNLLSPGVSAAPAWRLCQWGSRHILGARPFGEDDAFRATASGFEISNEAKAVRVSSDGVILLDINGNAEYDRPRKVGEAWPHLLVEQIFPEPIRLLKHPRLNFRLEARITHCKAAPYAASLDPNLHTAQVSAFFTVHHSPAGKTKSADMIWFGIPIFDARYPIPPPHFALDTGKADATGKFIALLDGARFWTTPTGDGEWHKLDVDLIPLLEEALQKSQEHGHLKDAKLEELALTTFNLGWEIPGPYDAALELRGLSLKGE